MFNCASEHQFERTYRDILSVNPQIIKEKIAKNIVEIFPLNFDTVADSYSSHNLCPQDVSLTHAPADIKYRNILKSLVKAVLWLLKARFMLSPAFLNNYHERHTTRSIFRVLKMEINSSLDQGPKVHLADCVSMYLTLRLKVTFDSHLISSSSPEPASWERWKIKMHLNHFMHANCFTCLNIGKENTQAQLWKQ